MLSISMQGKVNMPWMYSTVLSLIMWMVLQEKGVGIIIVITAEGHHITCIQREKIWLPQLKNYGYTSSLPENYTPHYQFATEETQNMLENGEDAAVVKMYYVDAKPWFLYNKKDGLYYRYEFGDKQVDGATGKQLAVKNIILQNCTSSLKDSKNGTLDINYQSGGTGKYITNGKAIDITWTRASASSKTQYYDENGKEIILNPGKTWVEIVENSRASQNVIYHTAEEFQK